MSVFRRRFNIKQPNPLDIDIRPYSNDNENAFIKNFGRRKGFATAYSANSLDLDGVNDEIDTNESLIFDRNDKFKFEAYYKIENDDNFYDLLETQSNAEYKGVIVAKNRDNQIELRLVSNYISGNSIIVKTDSKIPNNKWFKLTIYYNGTSSANGISIQFDGFSQNISVVSDNLSSSIQTNNNLKLTYFPAPTSASTLSATVLTESSIQFNWTDVTTTEDGFRLYISTGSSVQLIGENYAGSATTDATTLTVTGLTVNTTYYAVVVSFNEAGESEKSNEVSVSTLNPFEITVDTTLTGTSGSDQFALPLVSSGTYDLKVYDENYTLLKETTDYTDNIVSFSGVGGGGQYRLKIVGVKDGWAFNNAGDDTKLIEINRWGIFNHNNELGAFNGCSNLSGYTATDAPNLVGNSTTSLRSFFQNCSLLPNVNLNNWITSGITRLDNMFTSASIFNGFIDQWDVSSVTNFSGLFYNTSFNRDISSWNTSNATNIREMFRNSPFNQNITNWNVSKATDWFRIFAGNSAFNYSLGNWDVSLDSRGSLFIGQMFGSGMDVSSYSETLIGWASQSNISPSEAPNPNGLVYSANTITTGSSTTTSTNVLYDSSQSFIGLVSVGDVVYNNNDDTVARVITIVDDQTLLLDNDIMEAGETYNIHTSQAAKSRAKLILDDGWTFSNDSYTG